MFMTLQQHSSKRVYHLEYTFQCSKLPQTQQLVVETCGYKSALAICIELWLTITAVIHALMFLELRQYFEFPRFVLARKLDNASSGMHTADKQQQFLRLSIRCTRMPFWRIPRHTLHIQHLQPPNATAEIRLCED